MANGQETMNVRLYQLYTNRSEEALGVRTAVYISDSEANMSFKLPDEYY